MGCGRRGEKSTPKTVWLCARTERTNLSPPTPPPRRSALTFQTRSSMSSEALTNSPFVSSNANASTMPARPGSTLTVASVSMFQMRTCLSNEAIATRLPLIARKHSTAFRKLGTNTRKHTAVCQCQTRTEPSE